MITGLRLFSTSTLASARQYKYVVTRKVARKPDLKVGDVKPRKLAIPRTAPKFPEYKYGDSKIYKQSNKGLYGGQFLQFGNKISEFKNKNGRKWSLNVHTKSLWSEILNKSIRVKLTARVLRTINKEGGLDQYLLKDKSARIKELGPTGWKLKFQLLTKKENQKKRTYYQDLEKITVNGQEKHVYFQQSGKKFLVGKRRLLKELYPLVKGDSDLTWKEYHDQHKSLAQEEVIEKLHKYNYDFSEVAQTA
ncbi:54S ribosomal protein L24, mitochondrial [Komagataella phaffii CBS 7435]|uniref:Large ribosomal subunit protein bL28m n=2 Tax=Komagataella phaffii TaxID=460519 RepID=C4QZ93_KOMPG|nr:54S ribosomal protein L24, mitochondrial [Komagataella phaffii GS115]AOA61054.1 GQ67_01426T0 [Komagataella phaffii]CAH2447398.1 54S ribosomal protein L24, mitochondrial [Komagataella phaffii CBS 7435]AOA66586.1 GQ68_01442T0 [Komagataella phaffii GS115]CAY68567.1 54S ribosomal protein L24, mitochondrial [Komagataella phaffii GS115]CCA37630.1 54S ribosomal protein L24, mitochondrial [Komagataella phaffii CBS 7435]